MKKILLGLLTCSSVFFLTSCGGSFQREQTNFDRSRPCDCENLHLNHAEWHFKDAQGRQIDATGRCTKGMKHGEFRFHVNGNLVAKTKFSADLERKTYCYLNKQSTTLQQCMSLVPQNVQQQPSTQGLPQQMSPATSSGFNWEQRPSGY